MTGGVNIAVIGTGYWGRNLVRNFAALDCLYGLCDVDPVVREPRGRDYPAAKVFDHPDRVYADPAVEAVAIATPATTHGALVAQALDAGRHVFVEKPFCLDLDEGRRLADTAADKGLTLMVGHLLMYHPAFRSLLDLVERGVVGTPRYIYSNRLSLGKILRDENALWSFAPHDISMILRLLDRMPTRVTAIGGAWLTPNISDTTLSHLTFDGDARAHIFVSWLHPYKDHRLVVVGSDGMASFHDSVSGPEKLMHFPHTVGWNGNLPTVEKAEGVPVPYGDVEPLAEECRHYVACVTNGRTPRTDAEEGLRVLTVLDACQRALMSDQPVELESGS